MVNPKRLSASFLFFVLSKTVSAVAAYAIFLAYEENLPESEKPLTVNMDPLAWTMYGLGSVIPDAVSLLSFFFAAREEEATSFWKNATPLIHLMNLLTGFLVLGLGLMGQAVQTAKPSHAKEPDHIAAVLIISFFLMLNGLLNALFARSLVEWNQGKALFACENQFPRLCGSNRLFGNNQKQETIALRNSNAPGEEKSYGTQIESTSTPTGP